jgi:superfamily II DNA or RNA helicase
VAGRGAAGRTAAAAATDFLVTATPGAGKTSFALALAAELLERREVNRVVVVAPTDHLRTQWAEAAQAAGILLDPTLRNDDRLRPDVTGYVTTYAQVAMRPAVPPQPHEHSRRTLVVLDEIHHAGDGLSWGEAVAEAFEPARRRVALTGTPFRTRPDERIPFVRYEPTATARSPAPPTTPTATARRSPTASCARSSSPPTRASRAGATAPAR